MARRRPVVPAELVDRIARSARWRDVAACGDENPELFFPVAATGPIRAQEEARAKAVCARCPVVERCLRDALETDDWEAIRGGMTAEERRELKPRVSHTRTVKPAQVCKRTRKQPRRTLEVVPSRGSVDLDFEIAMSGRAVSVPRDAKGELARRMFAAGKCRSDIARALRMSGATVNKLLAPAEERAAS